MKAYEATEAAYRNGYEQGKRDAIKWIPVTERLPDDYISVLAYMVDAGEFPAVRECFAVNGEFYFPTLFDFYPVSHWAEMPVPPDNERNTGGGA